MKPFLLRTLFTLIFAVISTAVASVLMYTLPVLYYIGYQSQILPIIEGFLGGAIIFSIAGTLLSYYTKKSVQISLYISLIILVVLEVYYRLSGPTTDFDILVGAISTQSFAVFFASMFQSVPKPGMRKLYAVVSIAIFTVVSLVLFIITAEIYVIFGQAFLPNIVVYMEIVAAVLSAIILLIYARPNGKGEPSAS